MTKQTPEQAALAIAARIAHALDPDGWARCLARYPTCLAHCDLPRHVDNLHRGNHGRWFHDGTDWSPACAPLPPTLAEAQAEWAAAGGDPERGPAMSGQAEEGRIVWMVDAIETPDGPVVTMRIDVGCAYIVGPAPWIGDIELASTADIIELGRLAEAAADGGAL